MKHLYLVLSLSISLVGFSGNAFSQAYPPAYPNANWNNSPQNWNNSPQNWNNSPQNWNNSPQNWNNSPQNFNSNNGIYDNGGNRTGYQTRSPDGTVNFYDNNGNRIGYAPGR